MIGSSVELQQILRESHQIVTRVDVYAGSLFLATLAINDGNVRIDTGNKFRRTCDLTLSDPLGVLNPIDLTDLLHPLSGNEVHLYRGAYVPKLGTEEYIKLGVFVIKDAEILDSGSNVNIVLKCIDRGLRISEARAVQPLTIASGATAGSTIKSWTLSRYPGVEFRQDFDTVAQIVISPGVVERASDLWEVMCKIAKDVGYDLAFNNQGQLDLLPLPSGNVSSVIPAVEFNDLDSDNNTVLSIRKDLTRDDTYNHVVAYGQTTDGTAPAWGEAFESSPSHPLSVTGPMGDKPFFYSSGMLRTSAQCNATAQALLYKHLGHTEHIHFNNIVNPCLDANDIVRIYRVRMGIDAYYSLDNITIPLIAIRAMECDTRERFIIE